MSKIVIYLVFGVLITISCAMLLLQIANARNIKKSRTYFETLHRSLKPGVEVLLVGGIYGKITKVMKEIVCLEIAKNVEIKVDRTSIQKIIKE